MERFTGLALVRFTIFLQGGHSYIHLLNLEMIFTTVALKRNDMFEAVSLIKTKCLQCATFEIKNVCRCGAVKKEMLAGYR